MFPDCPIWNFDGSSTGQACGDNSDVYLHPISMFNDPFRIGKNKIVLCETFNHQNKPTGTLNDPSCNLISDIFYLSNILWCCKGYFQYYYCGWVDDFGFLIDKTNGYSPFEVNIVHFKTSLYYIT